MRIAVLSCFHPYRGGISQFSGCMLQELGKKHEVRAFNFKRQYPSALFPGKTQYVAPGDDSMEVESERILDSINPFSWGRTARAVLEWKPDAVLASWWMSFFGPSMGKVARILRRHGVGVTGILHNAIPHEPHFWDKPLTKYFLGGCSRVVTLSPDVQSSLEALGSYRSTMLFHPAYRQFGAPVPRAEAEKALGLEGGGKNLLFFGLIRRYKGLDILIQAMSLLPAEYRLIIAGEPYGSFDEYRALIDGSPAKDRIHLFTGFVPDSEVKNFFCAADLAVLPYRSATQSGVRAVACHFGVPMAVTDTGSLRLEVEGTGTGVVAPKAAPQDVADAILRFFGTPGLQEECRENIKKELDFLSWSRFCSELTDFISQAA